MPGSSPATSRARLAKSAPFRASAFGSSALMTGRHPIRDGTYSVPVDGKPYGLVQWEITIAKLLLQRGYTTALYGKWHLGDSEGRYPNDQGFDEWYGIPNSSDEALWPYDPDFDPAVAHFEYVMEGRRGEQTRKVKLYDNEARREIDGEVTDRTIDFMQRNAKAGKPFFAYVPLTQPHMPTEASKAFTGKTGNGPWADISPRWTTTPGGSSMQCRRSRSRTTPSSSSPATTARKRQFRGAAGLV